MTHGDGGVRTARGGPRSLRGQCRMGMIPAWRLDGGASLLCVEMCTQPRIDGWIDAIHACSMQVPCRPSRRSSRSSSPLLGIGSTSGLCTHRLFMTAFCRGSGSGSNMGTTPCGGPRPLIYASSLLNLWAAGPGRRPLICTPILLSHAW